MGLLKSGFGEFDTSNFATTNLSEDIYLSLSLDDDLGTSEIFDQFLFFPGQFEAQFEASLATSIVGAPLQFRAAQTAAEVTSSVKDAKISSGLFELLGYGNQLNAATTSAERDDIISRANASTDAVLGDYVVIDAYAADGAGEDLLAALSELGLIGGAAFRNVVSGLLPLTAVDALQSVDILLSASETPLLANAGSVTAQGVASARADVARATFGVDGSGLSIGVLSDSFNNLGGFSDDIASGDLPANITVLQDLPLDPDDPGSDEGRAILQLIHDFAPGADLLFQTAFLGLANFAQGIIALADAGADIIIDDVIFFAEPFYQDGIIAQAVDEVAARGVLYYSSAGNSGTDAYEATFRNSGITEGGTITVGTQSANISGIAHDFDPGFGVDTRQLLSLGDGDTLSLSFQYDEPFRAAGGLGATSDFDILLFEAGTQTIVDFSVADNPANGNPVEIFQFTNETGSTQQYELVIIRFSGNTDNLLRYIDFDGSANFLEFQTNSPTLVGHANAAGAVAVGASAFFNTPAFGLNPPSLNGFSSGGTVPILFDTNGNRLAVPEDRGGPLFVGPDGGNTTFFGTDIGFDSDSLPNFFGTSASAPAAAAIAALLLEAVPNATPDQVNQALIDTAIDIGTPGFDLASGAGLIQADAAIQALIANAGGGAGEAVATAGPDTLEGTPDADTISGLGGDDSISGLGSGDLLSGDAGDDTIFGGAGPDTLTGGSGLDSLVGGDGADVLSGGPDNNTLIGGAGPDVITSEGGDDFIDGGTNIDSVMAGSGNDIIFGRSGADTLEAGDGNDSVDAAGGFDLILGGNGDDTLIGSIGADTIEGGSGNDSILSGTNEDFVLGGDGDDTIVDDSGSDNIQGGLGDDFIDGASGRDTLIGNSGMDTILGGIGTDTIFGGDGDDSLDGQSNLDVIDGGTGNDTIIGGSGADTISGGLDNDEIDARGGFDSVQGDEGDDQILGGIGADTLSGGAGNDLIVGGSNNDVLIGGAGDDTLYGEEIGINGESVNVGGGDSFVFVDGFGDDLIVGFNPNSIQPETIDLSGVTAVTDFTDLIDNHLQTDPVTGDAIIVVGADSITLQGVAGTDLAADDFIF